MSDGSFGRRELLTRCKKEIPFGTKEKWEYFIEQYYVQCYIFADVIDDIKKYQLQIMDSILSGISEVDIWQKIITLDPNDKYKNKNYMLKAMVDGNMSVYGYPEIEFDNLETCIKKFMQNEKQKSSDESYFVKFGLVTYNYRVTIELIDESSHLYNVSVQWYENTLENDVFDDLLQFGIGISNGNGNENENKVKNVLSSILDEQIDPDALKAEMELIKHQMHEDGIELNFEEV